MTEQNYANHSRLVKGFHFVFGSLLLLGTIASIVNVWILWTKGEGIFSPLLIVLLFVCCLFLGWFTRQFAVAVQDRAIRAEENLRYFLLTRNALDKRVTMAQIIALRFASDEEFAELADRAIHENLSADEIKKAIKQWRPDNFRA